MSIEKITASKLDSEQRDALLTAFRDPSNNVGIQVQVGDEPDEMGLIALGIMDSLVKNKTLEPAFNQTAEDGSQYQVFSLTAFGKRVSRYLEKTISARLETMWVMLGSNDKEVTDTKWIKLENFDIVALEGAGGILEQFQMLKPHIPEGWYPLKLSRDEPKEIDL